MHVLVTGGAGFIGSHIVEWHLNRGDRVHVVDDLSTGRRENIAWAANNPDFHFEQVDLSRWDGMGRTCQWADRIYHMAAIVGVKKVLQDPIRVVAVNIRTTDFLLQAIQRTGWNPEIVIASSSEVYVHNPGEDFGEQQDFIWRFGHELRWTYAASKFAEEYLAFLHHRLYGRKIIAARLFNVIGPRQVGTYGMVVPTFVRQAVLGDDITVYGDGTQRRTFCDVRDTVQILVRLAANPAAYGQVVNVGAAQEVGIRALAGLVRERAQSRSKIAFVPYAEAYGEGFEEVFRRRPVLALQEQLTRYRPQRSLIETIDELIAIERNKATELYRAASRSDAAGPVFPSAQTGLRGSIRRA